MSIELQKNASQSKDNKFSEVCEQAIKKIEESEAIDDYIRKELAEKRAFGLKKYGESSGQASFSNLVNMPCMEHASEEMTDTLNYLLMMTYKKRLLGEKDSAVIGDMIETAACLKRAIDNYVSQARNSKCLEGTNADKS